MQQGLVAGVDPSPLMYARASKRLKGFAPRIQAELRIGTDGDLNWPDEHFNYVAALHSFQFWPEPEETEENKPSTGAFRQPAVGTAVAQLALTSVVT
jgi:methyltransferase family protein